MSYADYKLGLAITADYNDDDFYGLIQACMRLADTDNLHKLKMAFPDVYEDLENRYWASGGKLPEE